MRPHPRSLLLAAALIAPAAAAFAACGDSDQAAPSAAAKAATSAADSAPAPPTTPATLASRLRGVMDAGSPGVISLVNDGHGIKLQAAGVADKASGRAMTPTDRFRAGSNTKSFVATVALQLVGEGKLSLDDTVERWLPGVLPYGGQVNLRQLLNHTSGVPDYQKLLEPKVLAGGDSATRTYTPRDLVAMIADRKPDFAPETSWNYSSTGYILAGLIIERATGNRLGDELQDRIIRPLHLRDTSFPIDTTAIPGRHANGYGAVDGSLRDLTVFNSSAAWATGGVVSTAGDMAHYWRALLGGKLLAPPQLAAMKVTVPIGHGLPMSYGLGIMKFDQYNSKACGTLWGNGGDIPGYSTEFFNSEDGKVQAGIFVNVNPLPKPVAGQPLGAAKARLVAEAFGREHC
jgi:D-alanyl-D-alanine carboxypeptidase